MKEHFSDKIFQAELRRKALHEGGIAPSSQLKYSLKHPEIFGRVE